MAGTMMDNFEFKFDRIVGSKVQFEIDDLDAFKRELRKGHLKFNASPADHNMISNAQRKKIYALFRDISDYTGYEEQEVKHRLKSKFSYNTGYGNFSLSNCTKELATQFIRFVIEFCFRYDIPFDSKAMENTIDAERRVFLCLVHRQCTVCGSRQGLQINHEDTVGMGNNRNHIDHRNHRLEMLCFKHHSEFHNIGAKAFADKYHFHGIKLSDKSILSLKLMSQKQMDEFDEEYRRQKELNKND